MQREGIVETNQSQHIRAIENIRWEPVRNMGAQDIPPFGPFIVINMLGGSEGAGRYIIVRSVAEGPPRDAENEAVRVVGFAGPLGIKSFEFGKGTLQHPAIGRVQGCWYDEPETVVSPTDILPKLLYATSESRYLTTEPTGTIYGAFWPVGEVRDAAHCYFDVLLRDTQLAEISVATSTTTTADPAGTTLEPSVCSGRCKYDWVAAESRWEQVEDLCQRTTTTTSTTSTTTTACPCSDKTTTSTTSTTTTANPATSTTSTTTTTTSTTTPEPCRCMPPAYCGSADGECTYTVCAIDIIAEPTCDGTTTTTTTTDPGTTTCDCNTTTPLPTGCSAECQWAWTPSGMRQLTVCGEEATCGVCETPEWSPSPCHSPVTPCETVIVPRKPPCGGSHKFISNGVQWLSYSVDCTLNSQCELCSSPYPSIEPGPCNTTIDIPCVCSGTTQPPGNCPNCTTTTSTTTTVGPCGSGCLLNWANGTSWEETDNNCTPSCECAVPGFDGEDTCETAQVPCVSTTTTSTTSTTSTTPIPCTGTQLFECQQTSSGTYTWAAVAGSSCTGGCTGSNSCRGELDPDEYSGGTLPPCYQETVGSVLGGTCGCGTSTTLPPCIGGCTWQGSGGEWFVLSNQCSGSSTCFCGTEPVGTPAEGEIGSTPCTGTTTTTTTTTSTTTTAGPCGGNCWWKCNAAGSGWYRDPSPPGASCAGTSPCECTYTPSGPCTAGQSTSTPCGAASCGAAGAVYELQSGSWVLVSGSAPSCSGNCTNGDCVLQMPSTSGIPEGWRATINCTCSTSTSTSTATPCIGWCTWYWASGSWQIFTDTCSSGCTCEAQPGYSGTTEGESVNVGCE